MKRVRLGDVAIVELSGVDKKTKDSETTVQLCNYTDVYRNWAITRDMRPLFMVASANDNEINRFSLKRGQVALTKDSETRDDIGIAAYIADDFDDVLLGYHCALITPNDSQVSGKYINAYLHTSFVQKYFSDNASGSGQRYTLSVDVLNDIPLYLPSIEEQEEIGAIFSSIDKKISINRQINDYLVA
ncbi:MAG: restriction endonuclease subunit S [Bacteroidales bacterium]|nr:restriction endonuclease subunit S [Bacteroidales bacterium]